MAYVSQEKKKELAPAIKAVLKKYKMKASIAVRHHSELVVNVKSGVLDFTENFPKRNDGTFDKYIDVNTYWIDDHYTGDKRDFLNELKDAMEGPSFFNKDDLMTDYHHRSHYIGINIGKWNKDYECVA